tara:strand:- start:535 stop:789 length:255 start_codon:yes stop_codon:yes gene_type:complete
MTGPDTKEMKNIIESMGVEDGMKKITQLLWVKYLSEMVTHYLELQKDAVEELEKMGGKFENHPEERYEGETVKEYLARVRAKSN